MGNVLDDQKQHDIRALGRLGWTLSRIASATGVHRVTVGEYLRAAGIPKVDERGWTVGNVDASLVLERPKIMSHVPAMQRIIAELLRVGEDAVSIKATTNEKMGYVGRGEGVCAHAVALVHKA